MLSLNYEELAGCDTLFISSSGPVDFDGIVARWYRLAGSRPEGKFHDAGGPVLVLTQMIFLLVENLKPGFLPEKKREHRS